VEPVAVVRSHLAVLKLKEFMINIEVLSPQPPKENPFWHEHYLMGTQIGSNVMVMMPCHNTEDCAYIVVVNIETGERTKLSFRETNPHLLAEQIVNEVSK
jgi:hypothetical protein